MYMYLVGMKVISIADETAERRVIPDATGITSSCQERTLKRKG